METCPKGEEIPTCPQVQGQGPHPYQRSFYMCTLFRVFILRGYTVYTQLSGFQLWNYVPRGTPHKKCDYIIYNVVLYSPTFASSPLPTPSPRLHSPHLHLHSPHLHLHSPHLHLVSTPHTFISTPHTFISTPHTFTSSPLPTPSPRLHSPHLHLVSTPHTFISTPHTFTSSPLPTPSSPLP